MVYLTAQSATQFTGPSGVVIDNNKLQVMRMEAVVI
jgi:hypothetical protein